MRPSRVVKESDSQCRSRNCPGSDPSILRHSGIWGAADEAVLNIVHEKKKNPYFSFFFLPWFSSLLWKKERLLLWTGVLKRKPFPVSWRTRNQGKCVLPWRLGRVFPHEGKSPKNSRRCCYITMDFARGASQNVVCKTHLIFHKWTFFTTSLWKKMKAIKIVFWIILVSYEKKRYLLPYLWSRYIVMHRWKQNGRKTLRENE